MPVRRTVYFPHVRRLAMALRTLLLLAFGLPLVARAQSYHIRTYTEQDGLPCYAVLGVAQDGAGRMWFATNDGMVCYDGLSWETREEEEGYPRRGYRFAVASESGGIWAVHERSPIVLSYFDGEHCSRIPSPSTVGLDWWNVVAMAAGPGPDGREYVAVATAQGLVNIWNGTDWIVTEPDGELKEITALAFYRGAIGVATSAGLRTVDPRSGAIVNHAEEGLPTGAILGVTGSRAGDALWLFGAGWIGQLRENGFERLCDGLDIVLEAGFRGVSALEDPLGGLYFGDALAVYYFREGHSLEILSRENGLSSCGATDFHLDREGNIWVTSLRGVSKIISRRFAGYSHLQGLFEDEVSAVHQQRSGRIVLGHTAGLTFLEDEPRIYAFEEPSEKIGRVIDIEEDDTGTLWLACNRFGLGRLDVDERISWYGEDDGLSGAVYAVLLDRAGRMWVGTHRGLFQRTANGFDQIDLWDPTLSHIHAVRRVSEGPDGAIYVATRGRGVYRLLGDEILNWTDSGGLGGDNCYCVSPLPGGAIWVGTGSGLYTVAGDRLIPTVSPAPVIDRPVYSILEDDRDRIWFGTDAGVLRWDGEELAHFTVRDGLYGRETNRDALLLDAHGAVWIGTDGGVWVYREEYDLPSLAAPLLEILELEVDGERHPANEALVLDRPAGQITFRFRGISFLDEDRTRYRTWLEGFQADFEPARALPSQEIRYTNVPPGDYRFHVQAIGADGHESLVASTGELTVLPVVWLRWWALAAYGLLLLGVVRAGFSYYAKRRYAMDLEEEVRSRTLELQVSERAVKLESRKLEATLASTSDGVLALDQDRNVVLANPAAEQILGVKVSEIAGRPLASVLDGVLELEDGLPADGGTPVLTGDDVLSAALQGKGPRLFKHEQSAGSPRLLEITAAVMRGSDDCAPGTVLALRDVTARRMLETEIFKRQKLESLGLLAGGIAHDFNNLLTVIQGNLNLAAMHLAARDELKRPFESACRATENAGRLTRRLLTFAKGGAPKLEIVSVVDIVEEAVNLVMSGSSVACEVDVDADILRVEGDPTQIHQALGNILVNARQAMNDGGTIHVTCRNRVVEGTGPEVLIAIRDEGKGIPERDFHRIFDPYFTTKKGGSGLGLAIVDSIVDRHSGRLEVETDPDRGTTFTIYLPAIEEWPEPAAERAVPIAFEGGRVLVLDDEAEIRELLARMLEQLGYDCVTVADGMSAVRAFETARATGEPFVAVVLDLTVPGGMGGVETLECLREVDPHVLGIVSSGYSDDPVVADFRTHGFAGCLEKPYTLDQVQDVLASTVHQARSRSIEDPFPGCGGFRGEGSVAGSASNPA